MQAPLLRDSRHTKWNGRQALTKRHLSHFKYTAWFELPSKKSWDLQGLWEISGLLSVTRYSLWYRGIRVQISIHSFFFIRTCFLLFRDNYQLGTPAHLSGCNPGFRYINKWWYWDRTDSEDVNHGGVCSGLCGTQVGKGKISPKYNDVYASSILALFLLYKGLSYLDQFKNTL